MNQGAQREEIEFTIIFANVQSGHRRWNPFKFDS